MTTPTTVNVRLQLRADTAANWTAANPTLLANEVGLETDTKKLKVGNGSSAWNSLAYFPSIVSGGTVLGNLEIGSTGTLTFEGSTADGFETTLAVTNPTADRTITLPNQSGTVVVSGNASIVNADIAANAEIAVSKLANGTANQVIVTDGTNVSWSDDLTLAGNLTVNGTTTTINTQDLLVEDKNIIIGNVTTPSDVTADGGGITLKGTTDKTINWVDATDAWTSSERFSVPLGSAASPSLTFTGDENTGIYSPGADQVAISTNGTGRLFVDASGNIGAGTNTPATLLHVDGGTITSQRYANSGAIILRRAEGTQSSPTAISSSVGLSNLVSRGYDGSTYREAASIQVFSDGAISSTSSPGAILFGTTPSGAVNTQERLRITSAGLVGVGTSSPSELLHVSKDQNAITAIKVTNPNTGASAASYLSLESGTKNVAISAYNAGSSFQIQGFGGIVTQYQDFDTHIWRNNAGTERARIDSSGRLLVGTSSAPAPVAGFGSNAIQVVNQSAYAGIVNLSTSNDAFGPHFSFGKSRGGTSTIVQNNDNLGSIRWGAADGTDVDTAAALIEAYVDGTPGANDMPGRLVFSTTADAASSPTERMRITNGGFTKLTNDGTYYNSTGGFHEARTTSNDASLIVTATNATYTKEALRIFVTKAANSDWWFADYWSGVTTDREFQFRGDGNAFADGTWTGGGADYAEYFEWADSNPDAEDRRGISVVLDGNKIREAQAGEDPIGVISGNPSVVGDAAWNKWSGKYLRDEFGTYIQEDYEVTDDDGNTVTQQRRKLNPAYDPDVEYTSREERPEWDCVGLMGKLRLRKGQPTGSRWIKMRDISDSVEEWLVR